MLRSRDQFDVFIQSAGWRASSTQPPAASTGRKPIRKTPSEKRGHPHFVQPPTICESAIVSPAAAMPVRRPVLRRRLRADLRREPEQDACDRRTGERRDSTSSRSSPPPFREDRRVSRLQIQRMKANSGAATLVEAGRAELGAERFDRPQGVVREDVVDDADRAVVRKREIDVCLRDEIDGQRLADRAADRKTDPVPPNRCSPERLRRRRRGGRPRPPLGIAVEAPRLQPAGAPRPCRVAPQRRPGSGTSSDRRTSRRARRGAQSRSSCETRPGCSSPQLQSN